MASIISAGTTSGTSLNLSADTSGQLELKTGSGPTTAITISSAQLTTIANDATISGLTVGKGGGAITGSTALGNGTLRLNTTGINTAGGYQSLYSVTTGTGSTAFGNSALKTNTANYNNAFGENALVFNTTGTDNNSFGVSALQTNTTGTYNTAVGNYALFANTTANNNTALGWSAGTNVTTGASNTYLGQNAGYWQTTGNYNVAVGSAAFQGANGNATGSNNVAVGYYALISNTTASGNTAVGYQAGYTVSTAYSSVFIGYQAVAQSTATGYENVFVGYQSGFALTTGNHNACLGFQAGSSIAGGNGNVMIGKNGQPSAASGSDQTCIGANLTGKGNSTFFCSGTPYNGANTSTWATTSDRRLKKNIVDNNDGLDKITAIQVRNFEYRTAEEVTELPEHTVIKKEGVQLGVIAQEIAQVLPECVKEETTGVLRVDTDNLTWYLINAVKELNAKVEAQAAEIAALKGAK